MEDGRLRRPAATAQDRRRQTLAQIGRSIFYRETCRRTRQALIPIIECFFNPAATLAGGKEHVKDAAARLDGRWLTKEVN